MRTRAVRLYGKNDLRTEYFELPPLGEDEILARVVCDSLCLSSYKAAILGPEHKRIPKDVAERPIILGHEFCGVIERVGARWREQFSPGERFAIQPALNYKGSFDAPGYSFPCIGGCATYIIIPPQVMELGCLLPYKADTFFYGSLAEPISCVIGSFREFFHRRPNDHAHHMGVKPGGSLAILAGAGPMGLAATDYAVHAEPKPARIVVTDVDENRLAYARRRLSPDAALACGVELTYLNTAGLEAPAAAIRAAGGVSGFDDVLVMAPVRSLVEMGSALLGYDGCLSFFAGPSDSGFEATVNFYNVHYEYTHFIGTVGGNSDDMREAVEMSAKGLLNPAVLVTHIGGLDSAADATLNLPRLPGGKKLIYTGIDMELTAVADFREKGRDDELFGALADIVERHDGLWCPEAEALLLSSGKASPE